VDNYAISVDKSVYKPVDNYIKMRIYLANDC